MYTNLNFLKEASSFKYLMQSLNTLNTVYLIEDINLWNNAVSNLDGRFLPLALKALGISNIEFFLRDGKALFNNFTIITTHEGLLGVLKSLFLSDEITITTLSPSIIDITVVNKNAALVANYVDENSKLYVDGQILHKDYVGFKAGSGASLEAFFNMFLRPLLPAGVVLNSITITTPEVTQEVTNKQPRVA